MDRNGNSLQFIHSTHLQIRGLSEMVSLLCMLYIMYGQNVSPSGPERINPKHMTTRQYTAFVV